MDDRPLPVAQPASESVAMIRRAAIVLAFILFWAFAATPQDPLRSVAVMALAVAIIDAMIAGLRAQKLTGGSISYWDSAALFLIVHLAARVLA